jgi:hypothetical protein
MPQDDDVKGSANASYPTPRQALPQMGAMVQAGQLHIGRNPRAGTALCMVRAVI